jgi:hypothetical protein
MVPRKSTSRKSFFKWRNRLTKSASESDVRDLSFASPLTSLSAPLNFQGFEPTQPRPPSSPFVSESAHVFSLQHPAVTRFSGQFPDSSDIPPSKNSTDSISPMNNSGTNVRLSTPPSSPPSSMGFYVKAKKSLESKLKLKARREVSSFRSQTNGSTLILTRNQCVQLSHNMSINVRQWMAQGTTQACSKSLKQIPVSKTM